MTITTTYTKNLTDPGNGDLALGALGIDDHVRWDSIEAQIGTIGGFAIIAPLAGVGGGAAATSFTWANRLSAAVTIARSCYERLDAQCMAQAMVGIGNIGLSSLPIGEFSAVMAAYTSLVGNLASLFVNLIARLDAGNRYC